MSDDLTANDLLFASTDKLARLLRNTASTMDSEDADLALASHRNATNLADELRRRGEGARARAILEGEN